MSPALSSPPGLDSQLEEIGVDSNTGLFLRRHSLPNRSGSDVSASGSVLRSLSCTLSHSGEVCDSSRFSLSAGVTSVNVRLSSPGPSQVSTSAALPVDPLASQSGPVIGQDCLGSPILGPVPVLGNQAIQCSSGEASAGSCSPVGYIHRCFHQGLGSPLWQSVSSRPLAAFRGDSSHQRAGVTSHSEGSRPLPPSDQRQGSDVPLRQQLCSGIPSEPGVHSLSQQQRAITLPAARDHPVGEAHPWPSECSSRQPAEKESDHWDRMVPASWHSSPDVLHLVHLGMDLFATRPNHKLPTFHNHPEQVYLFAWGLSSIPLETNSFLRQLPGVSARQLEHLPLAFYDCKWRVYESSCLKQQISPLQATVQQLADFFEFLFSSRPIYH